jgi:hypothetical protein
MPLNLESCSRVKTSRPTKYFPEFGGSMWRVCENISSQFSSGTMGLTLMITVSPKSNLDHVVNLPFYCNIRFFAVMTFLSSSSSTIVPLLLSVQRPEFREHFAESLCITRMSAPSQRDASRPGESRSAACLVGKGHSPCLICSEFIESYYGWSGRF